MNAPFEPFAFGWPPQMCTVDDLTGEEPCRRVAQWQWQPDGPGTHPVFLCNFHAEPLTANRGMTP